MTVKQLEEINIRILVFLLTTGVFALGLVLLSGQSETNAMGEARQLTAAEMAATMGGYCEGPEPSAFSGLRLPPDGGCATNGTNCDVENPGTTCGTDHRQYNTSSVCSGPAILGSKPFGVK